MHSYLRAIGFSGIKNISDEKDIIDTVIRNHWLTDKICTRDLRDLIVYKTSCGKNMELTLCGEIDKNGAFIPQYIYPSYTSDVSNGEYDVIVEKRSDVDAYLGGIDDVRVGTTLVFHLINFADYLDCIDFARIKPGQKQHIMLSGLSDNGIVLLPLENQKDNEDKKIEEEERKKLITAAQNGDTDAMESLTLEEFDTYSMLIERIEVEDVYTIVDSFFMPKGISSDKYSVMGNIIKCESRKNTITNEEVIQLQLDCNGIIIGICMHKDDLTGEPECGRRFKGDIWLQGYISCK